MEWRIFYPLIENATSEQVQALRCLYSKVTAIFSEIGSEYPVEERNDDYLLLPKVSCLGIKYRSEEKLEMKHRSMVLPNFGIEIWEKTKFKKKPLAEQKVKLIKELQKRSLSIEHMENISLAIDQEKYVSVLKKRRVIPIDGTVCFEFCEVEVLSETQSTCPKRWISIAVEANNDQELIAYLKSSAHMQHFFLEMRNVITQCSASIDNGKTLLEEEKESINDPSTYKPLLAGYPLWSQYISHVHAEEDLQHSMTTLQQIIDHVVIGSIATTSS